MLEINSVVFKATMLMIKMGFDVETRQDEPTVVACARATHPWSKQEYNRVWTNQRVTPTRKPLCWQWTSEGSAFVTHGHLFAKISYFPFHPSAAILANLFVEKPFTAMPFNRAESLRTNNPVQTCHLVCKRWKIIPKGSSGAAGASRTAFYLLLVVNWIIFNTNVSHDKQSVTLN